MKYWIITLIFIASLASSIILSLESEQIFCQPGEGCNFVTSSKYAYTFEIKNSIYGIIIFSILTLLTISQSLKPNKRKKKIINISIIVGSLISVYFLYLQQFVLKEYCKYCLVVDIGILLALAIIIWDKSLVLKR